MTEEKEKKEQEKTIVVNNNVQPEQQEEQPVQILSLFGNCKPAKAIQKATELADAVADIIAEKHLYVPIKNKKYVFCEGWTTMGALLGVFAHVVETENLSDYEVGLIKYKSTVEVKTLSGKTVSRAEALCSNDEAKWKDREEYAILSMSETRAISKTLRIPLGWIMQIRGYQPTSAEEITPDMVEDVILDNEGNIDQMETELANAVPQQEGETIKVHIIRQIQWILEKKLKQGMSWFKEKVKDIDSLGTQSQIELAEIRTVLWNYHKHGITIKKIKVEKKEAKDEKN